MQSDCTFIMAGQDNFVTYELTEGKNKSHFLDNHYNYSQKVSSSVN